MPETTEPDDRDTRLIPLALYYVTTGAGVYRAAQQTFSGHLVQARHKGATFEQIAEAAGLPLEEVRRVLGVDAGSVLFPDQRSTTDQLRDLIALANGAGMYDAADFCRREVERVEARLRAIDTEENL